MTNIYSESVKCSLVVRHRSNSPWMTYQYQYHTDMYRLLSESTIPIIDRATDPYRFRLSINFTDVPTLLSAPYCAQTTC